MGAPFGAQIAIGIRAINFHGDTLDAGFFAISHVGDGGLEAAPLGPAQIHAQQDLRPILGFRATRTSMDTKDGGIGIMFPAKGQRGFASL